MDASLRHDRPVRQPVAFPDRESATAWYESAAYQEIVPLRAA
jgi:uncharacterized protein (DUF1330 family)